MLARGLIEPATAWLLFEGIEAQLYRYPDIDPGDFRRAVASALGPEPEP